MARLLLGTAPQSQTDLDSRAKITPRAMLSPAAVEVRLRQPRNAAYVAAMTRADSGGHIHEAQTEEKLLAALREEFPDISVEKYPEDVLAGRFPVGIVAKCFLGAPYEVHTFDFGTLKVFANIVRHYKTFESLPGAMENARSLALNPAYEFVEIYTDKLIAVARSGASSIVPLAAETSTAPK